MSITLAHGFTQTNRSWDVVTSLLTERNLGPVRAVDLPGHGTASDVQTDLWGAAQHLVDAGGIGTYIGYSMGGRMCLHAALVAPDVVRRLVLIGATPGIVDDDERSARRASDDRLAAHIEQIGVSAFLDEWLRLPLFAGLTPETAGRRDRLRNTANGLASSLRLAGTGTQQPLWDRLGEISVPVLLIVGQDDVKFRGIADQMAALLPRSSMAVIADAGHSAHLEQPERTVEAIASWFSSR